MDDDKYHSYSDIKNGHNIVRRGKQNRQARKPLTRDKVGALSRDDSASTSRQKLNVKQGMSGRGLEPRSASGVSAPLSGTPVTPATKRVPDISVDLMVVVGDELYHGLHGFIMTHALLFSCVPLAACEASR